MYLDLVFFFYDSATTEIYKYRHTLSLHDALPICNLSTPVAFPPDDEQVALLQEKGLAHERDYLAHLKAGGRTVVEIAGDASVEEKAARTRAALREGPDVDRKSTRLNSSH